MRTVRLRSGDHPGLFDYLILQEVQPGDPNIALCVHLHEGTHRQAVAALQQPRWYRLHILVRHAHILNGAHMHRGEIGLHDRPLIRQGIVRMPTEHHRLRILLEQAVQSCRTAVAAVYGAAYRRMGDDEDGFAVVCRVFHNIAQRFGQPGDGGIAVTLGCVIAFHRYKVVIAHFHMPVGLLPGRLLIQIIAVEPLSEHIVKHRGVGAAGTVMIAQTEKQRQIIRQIILKHLSDHRNLSGRFPVYNIIGDIPGDNQGIQPVFRPLLQNTERCGDIGAVVRVADRTEAQHDVLLIEIHRLL